MPETSTGVYVVALSPSADAMEGTYPDAPLSDVAVDELCAVCPALTLDGAQRPARAELAKRIGSYWLPDETVLYVGLAGQPLRNRVRQYYKTPLGAARPHKGGWWLKTLSVLCDLHVHFAATADFKNAEESMLRAFAANVSDDSRNRLPADEPVMPFANLRDGDWRRRNHGIAGATAGTAAKPTPTAPVKQVPAAASPPQKGASARRTTTQHHRSQNVTATDIAVGQVAFPVGRQRLSCRASGPTSRWCCAAASSGGADGTRDTGCRNAPA